MEAPATSRAARSSSLMDLIAPTDRGLYCAAGDFHIDPWRPVARALITHAHCDHARFGSDLYVCHRDTAPILRKRLGDVAIETVDYGETLTRNGVEISFHPAGHVLGSAQIRVAHRGEVWVASGDYKLENDGVVGRRSSRCAATSSSPNRPSACRSTAGARRRRIIAAIDAWWRENAAAGRASVLYAYALGKAQRVLAHVDRVDRADRLPRRGRADQRALSRRRASPCRRRGSAARSQTSADFAGALIVAPPSAAASPWLKRFGDYSDALASGWMQVRGNRRRRGLDRGFALSDHADWPGLLAAIEATGAERVLATHGAVGPLTRYLQREGPRRAASLPTAYGEEDEAAERAPPESAA